MTSTNKLKQNKCSTVDLCHADGSISHIFKFKFRRFEKGVPPHDTALRVNAEAVYLDNQGFVQGYTRRGIHYIIHDNTVTPKRLVRKVRRSYIATKQPPCPQQAPYHLARVDGKPIYLYCQVHSDTYIALVLHQSLAFVLTSALPCQASHFKIQGTYANVLRVEPMSDVKCSPRPYQMQLNMGTGPHYNHQIHHKENPKETALQEPSLDIHDHVNKEVALQDTAAPDISLDLDPKEWCFAYDSDFEDSPMALQYMRQIL